MKWNNNNNNKRRIRKKKIKNHFIRITKITNNYQIMKEKKIKFNKRRNLLRSKGLDIMLIILFFNTFHAIMKYFL